MARPRRMRPSRARCSPPLHTAAPASRYGSSAIACSASPPARTSWTRASPPRGPSWPRCRAAWTTRRSCTGPSPLPAFRPRRRGMPSDIPAALKGVSRLAQASTLTVDGVNRVAVRRYWHPAELLESARLSPTDVRDRFLQLMAQAAARSLTGKDAILLSGGIDSPAVAAFAAPDHRQRTGRPIGALSCVFPDLPTVDERRYIELVAQHFGIELHTYRPRARALDDVEQWCRLLGSPVPILSVPEVADSHARARRLGYENVLTGDFAEFAFGNP